MTTVLVAEPDAGQRQLIDLLLAAEDWSIVLVPSGEEALLYLEDQAADVALLALDLPDIPGDVLCTRIRRLRERASMPVILVAPPTMPLGLSSDDRERARKALADLILPRPLGDKNLRERMERLLNERTLGGLIQRDDPPREMARSSAPTIAEPRPRFEFDGLEDGSNDAGRRPAGGSSSPPPRAGGANDPAPRPPHLFTNGDDGDDDTSTSLKTPPIGRPAATDVPPSGTSSSAAPGTDEPAATSTPPTFSPNATPTVGRTAARGADSAAPRPPLDRTDASRFDVDAAMHDEYKGMRRETEMLRIENAQLKRRLSEKAKELLESNEQTLRREIHDLRREIDELRVALEEERRKARKPSGGGGLFGRRG